MWHSRRAICMDFVNLEMQTNEPQHATLSWSKTRLPSSGLSEPAFFQDQTRTINNWTPLTIAAP